MKILPLVVVLVAIVCGCRTGGPGAEPAAVPATGPLIAVFPVEALSGKAAPLDEIRRLLLERLRVSGLRILDDAILEDAVTRHRVRYTAGVEREFAIALKREVGADAVLIPSLELYDTTPGFPRVALFARLVSTGDTPTVVWTDGAGAAGDDAPGILGIGIVEDPVLLLSRASDSVVRSLTRHVLDTAGPGVGSAAGKFRPKIIYRSEAIDAARTYSIAIVPFFNKSARPYAGELLALHMMRNLTRGENLAVVEPGIVRQELLRYRIIMNEGVSLADTDTVLNAVDADLVLNGEVLQYDDPVGPTGAPIVDFSVLFIERKTRRVLYSSYSHNAGDDGVFFFDWGRVNTAHAMAAGMARAIASRMLHGPATAEIRGGGTLK